MIPKNKNFFLKNIFAIVLIFTFPHCAGLTRIFQGNTQNELQQYDSETKLKYLRSRHIQKITAREQEKTLLKYYRKTEKIPEQQSRDHLNAKQRLQKILDERDAKKNLKNPLRRVLDIENK